MTWGYKEDTVQIKSAVIFSQNLEQLEAESDWKIEYNEGRGEYTIERDWQCD